MRANTLILSLLLLISLGQPVLSNSSNLKSTQNQLEPNTADKLQDKADSFIQSTLTAKGKEHALKPNSGVSGTKAEKTSLKQISTEKLTAIEMNAVTDDDGHLKARALYILLFCLISLVICCLFLHFVLSAAKESRKALTAMRKRNEGYPPASEFSVKMDL